VKQLNALWGNGNMKEQIENFNGDFSFLTTEKMEDIIKDLAIIDKDNLNNQISEEEHTEIIKKLKDIQDTFNRILSR
jgi:hypothetical protein